MDLHEYAEDVAADVVREQFLLSTPGGELTACDRAIAHAVADAVADLWADPA